jgi:hypothetical protein
MSKPNTFMTGPHHSPLRGPKIEAAKFLASAARRFVAERATVKEVDDAIACWNEAQKEVNKHEDTEPFMYGINGPTMIRCKKCLRVKPDGGWRSKCGGPQ